MGGGEVAIQMSMSISMRQEGKTSRNELTGNLPWSWMLDKPFIFEIKVTSNYFWSSKVQPFVPPFSSCQQKFKEINSDRKFPTLDHAILQSSNQ